jgi:hypothetical protein
LLPFYGTSELVKPAGNKAADFFQTYPTGFNVFSVGKPGAASLILLEIACRHGFSSSWKKGGDFDFADLVFFTKTFLSRITTGTFLCSRQVKNHLQPAPEL